MQVNKTKKIVTSSTAEYFAKNLQQVGFSSPLKAVLTTLKEAVDNSLDACEEAGLLPEIKVEVKKIGASSVKNTDLIQIVVEDNGPGLDLEFLPKVFGEYLTSSKFGQGQCSRGQQGIGISAATTWAQLTNASGVLVVSKTSRMKKAVKAFVTVDIKNNKGVIKSKETIGWDRPHGLSVHFRIDGKAQIKGEGGLLTYLEGTTLVNPHLDLRYKLLDSQWIHIKRVAQAIPQVPPPTLPHPHTMKLGEFMTHAHLFDNLSLNQFLKKAFFRISNKTIEEFVKKGLPRQLLKAPVYKNKEEDFKKIFSAIQKTDLPRPSTQSVMTIGEESLSSSILRLGEVDFFSVNTRKPKICDFKPVVVEVAMARFLDRGAEAEEKQVQLLRFANRVPLQFDKSSCAITKAVESINWKAYGLSQARNSLPSGPYVIAVSVTSPFIKFKNASKETIDASQELVEEIRLALMQGGQKLSRHLKREHRALELERKIAHIERFAPIFVETLCRIAKANNKRKQKAVLGLKKILGRDSNEAEKKLEMAEEKLAGLKGSGKIRKESFVEKKGEEEQEKEKNLGEKKIEKKDVKKGKTSKNKINKRVKIKKKEHYAKQKR